MFTAKWNECTSSIFSRPKIRFEMVSLVSWCFAMVESINGRSLALGYIDIPVFITVRGCGSWGCESPVRVLYFLVFGRRRVVFFGRHH
jgi:hypothetical protein